MTLNGRDVNLFELLWVALSLPPVTLVIAGVIVTGALLLKMSRLASAPLATPPATPRPVRARYRPEHIALGWLAVTMIAVCVADFIIRGFVVSQIDRFDWWEFATLIITAVLGLGLVALIIATRKNAQPNAPGVSTSRRTWRTFSSPSTLTSYAVATVGLIVTTVLAGLASSPNDDGEYVLLTIPIPNAEGTDPLRFPFYGWTFGVPVLVMIVVLTLTAWIALQRNSARRFLRADTIVAERAARQSTAIGINRIATAAILLSLAAAWRLIGSMGSISQVTIEGQNAGQPYEASWRYGELALAAGWGAPVIEIVAFALLLLVAVNGLRRTRVTHKATVNTHAPAHAEVSA